MRFAPATCPSKLESVTSGKRSPRCPTHSIWRRCLLIFALAAFGWCASGFADINFVQVTDPHIFDGKGDIPGNKEALRWCINQLNGRVDAKADYKFVIVTGDLGLEGLPAAGNEKEPNAIIDRAKQLAEILKEAKVKQWLFLPGNNDLEEEDPRTIGTFHKFIQALKVELPGMTIVDFCPVDNEEGSGVHLEGTCRFIGFNNASFKSNDLGTNAEEKNGPFHSWQLKHVEEVLDRLKPPADFKSAFVFYHIPEIDDPYYVSLDPNHRDFQKREKDRGELGKDFPYSAWTVAPDVRSKWNEVVRDERVKGLFAGHFHSADRAVYQNFKWVRDPNYLSGSLLKLSVCPPLASKKQEGAPVQARGFREVSVDCDSGEIKSTIFWYDRNRGENPQLLEQGLVLAVDPANNSASGLIHLSNPSEKEISISLSADDFKSQTTGFGLNSKVLFAAPNQAAGQPVYETKLPPRTTAAVKVDVNNFGEAGEATACVRNYGESIGTLRATKSRPPFSIKIVSPTPDKPELKFTKGKSSPLTLKNDDQMTYPVEVSIEVDGVWSKPSFARLTAGGTTSVELKPRAEWFPGTAWMKESIRDGNIRLELRLPDAGDKPALAERIVPFKAHLNSLGESWQTLLGYLFVLVCVTVGGVGSMILSNWIPNRLSRADIEEQLNDLAGRTRDLSTCIDSGLRVFLRVERNRVQRYLKSWWTLSANFPDVVKQCIDRIAVLGKQIDLATQLDRARLGLEHAIKASPIAAKVALVDHDLRKAADLLRRSEPRTEDLDAAKVLIVNSTEQISKMEQSEPEPDSTFAAALSDRINSLNTSFATPSPALTELRNLLPKLFASLPAAPAANVPPSQYSSVDRTTAQLELVREYLGYYDPAATPHYPKQDQCIQHLKTETPLGLANARLLLKQIKENVFVEDILRAIHNKSAEISVASLPIEDQLVKFTVQFKDERLNTASAQEEIRCRWDFQDGTPTEIGWEAYHYFRIAAVPRLDRFRALRHRTWVSKKPESKNYTVTAAFGAKIARMGQPPPLEEGITVSKAPANASSDRNRAELVRLGIALIVALIGLLAGAREKLATLDVVPAAIAVILLGFGADTIKNLISPKQAQK